MLLTTAIAPDGRAQLGIGSGFEYGTAMFVSKQILVRKPSLGISAILSYAPRYSKLFPSFTYLLKSITIPISNSYYTDQAGTAGDQHYVLNMNYRNSLETDHYELFMGAGIARIKPDNNLSDEWGSPVMLIDTTSAYLYPTLQVGCKYMHRILSNSSFFLGIEANIKYIRMNNDNDYTLQYGTNSVKATIGGDVIFPGILVQLCYVFDRHEY